MTSNTIATPRASGRDQEVSLGPAAYTLRTHIGSKAWAGRGSAPATRNKRPSRAFALAARRSRVREYLSRGVLRARARETAPVARAATARGTAPRFVPSAAGHTPRSPSCTTARREAGPRSQRTVAHGRAPLAHVANSTPSVGCEFSTKAASVTLRMRLDFPAARSSGIGTPPCAQAEAFGRTDCAVADDHELDPAGSGGTERYSGEKSRAMPQLTRATTRPCPLRHAGPRRPARTPYYGFET